VSDEGAEAQGEGPASAGDGGGWRSRDHTRGSLFTSLFVLALPLIGSSVLFGVVFQLFELGFLSRLGEAPLTAVVITNQTVRQVFFMLVMGSGLATQSLIARAVGAGDLERAEHLAGQAIALGAGVSLFGALVGGLLPGQLFSLPGPDASFYPYGVPYVRLVFLLNFGVVGTQLFGAILGGAGDTTTPLLVQVVQTGVAITAEWVLIFGHLGLPALGVQGVALGVASGQICAISLGLWVLFRGVSRVHLRLRHVVPDPAVMARIVRIAWPPALQMIGGVATNFAFVRLAGGFGEHVQAAFAIGLRLGMIVPMLCFPLAGATATLVGQALGAGRVGRAWRAIGVGLVVHGSIMVGFAAIIVVFRHELMALLADDPDVIRIGAEYLVYAGGSFLFFAFYFVMLRSLQGAGDFLAPMGISLSNTFGLTIPLGYGLSQWTDLGATGIWIAGLAGSATVTTATGAWLATGRWTRRAPQSGAP
jgi:putative MATE family efflux protein